MVAMIKWIGFIIAIAFGAFFLTGMLALFIATYRLRGSKIRKGTICSFYTGYTRHTGTVISSNSLVTTVRSHIDLQKHNVFTKDLCI